MDAAFLSRAHTAVLKRMDVIINAIDIVSGPLREAVPRVLDKNEVAFGALRVEHGIADDYVTARQYLSQDPGRRSILLQLEDGRTYNGTTSNVVVLNRENNAHPYAQETTRALEYDHLNAVAAYARAIFLRMTKARAEHPSAFVDYPPHPEPTSVYWSPSVGQMTAHGPQSPAFQLGHELDHAFYDALDHDNSLVLSKRFERNYDTHEEKRVIERDNAATQFLPNEAIRTTHVGIPFRAENVTSTSGEYYRLIREDAQAYERMPVSNTASAYR